MEGLEWRGGLLGGPGASEMGQDHMPGWDGEAEEAQGWGKAEPLSVGAEDLEKGLGRAGCAWGVVAAPG